jgi:UDP-N-acetyl-D-galactosamine dehydrogenase
MGKYIAEQTAKKIIAKKKDPNKARALVMGATFKEDVSDIRNSKVADVIKELESYGIKVDVVDPFASSKDLKHEYGFELASEIGKNYDSVLVAVNHNEYKNLSEDYFKTILANDGILVDIKGIYRGKIKDVSYWSL